MSSLDLSRWQFALTTLIHFAIVGASIGLTVHVALMQTRWLRTGDERWLRLTKYYARPMLVCFAIGVVTGMVQTFQFGMNWSSFSAYVGDIFGAPLALEGLGAFFIEAIFLGVWIFGWGRLSPRLHLATIWLVAIATSISAYAILSANTWMQGPTGYEIVDGKARVTDVVAVLFNIDVALAALHVVLTALLTGAVVVLAIAALNLRRGRDVEVFRKAATLACTVGLIAGTLGIFAGHYQGVRAIERQPMKMAAAEALYDTQSPAALSLFAIGPLKSNPGPPVFNIELPGVLSLLNDFSLTSTVRGIHELEAEAVARFGPGDYVPVVPLMYWSFRIMTGAGMALVALMALGLGMARCGRLHRSPRLLRVMVAAAALPFLAQSGGWLLREGGRQPWIVQNLMLTRDGNSDVSVAAVLTSMVVFLGIYGITVVYAARTIRRELDAGLPAATVGGDDHDPDAPVQGTNDLALGY